MPSRLRCPPDSGAVSAPTTMCFAIECFMDELARKAGKDPIAFRRAMLGKAPRMQAVLDLLAEKIRLGANHCRRRRGAGVSLQPTFESSIATVVEAEVGDLGDVRLAPRHLRGRYRHCR